MRDRTEEALARLTAGIREGVADQVRDLIMETPAVGSRDLVGKRLRQCIQAEADGDRVVRRASAMDLSVAAAVWAIAMDLEAARHGVASLATEVSSEVNGDRRM